MRVSEAITGERITGPPLMFQIPTLVVPVENGDASSVASATTTIITAMVHGVLLSSASAVLDVGKFGFKLGERGVEHGVETLVRVGEAIDKHRRVGL